MIIDFHTHIFPDRIAQKTIELLAQKADTAPYSDGTEAGLVQKAKDAGVNICVALPVLTKPTQFSSVTAFAIGVNERYKTVKKGRILSFGGIHPRCDDIEGKMQYLKDNGFLGVKIHPDYQQTEFDDEGYLRIIESAKRLDMIVVTHAGVDGAYRGETKCTPERVARVIDLIGHDKLVLAHMGGDEMFGEVYEKIAGKSVYLDTAFVLPTISKAEFASIAEKHGTDKILFATDSPWRDIKAEVARLDEFGLSMEDKDKILYKNALNLLGEENL